MINQEEKKKELVLDEDFDACFKVLDIDNSGAIEQDEMVDIIRKVIGIGEKSWAKWLYYGCVWDNLYLNG